MAQAYAEAKECKPIGCPCQLAAEQLTVDSQGIIEIQQQIADWEVTVSGLWDDIIANE